MERFWAGVMSAIYRRTRRQRRRTAAEKSAGRIFAVVDEPLVVLAYLTAVEVARVARCGSGLRSICGDGAVLGRLAASRAAARYDGSWLAGATGLRRVFAAEALSRAAAAWRVVRVRRRAGYDVVPGFASSPSTLGESALLVHARDKVCLEVVGASNGWYRWSVDGVDGAGRQPLTGTPPSWMDANQDWDADWRAHVASLEPLAASLATRAAAESALPGNWTLGVVGGTLAVRNGNVWIHLTDAGFRSAQSNSWAAPEFPPFDPIGVATVATDFKAKYVVSHPAASAPTSADADPRAAGPWTGARVARRGGGGAIDPHPWAEPQSGTAAAGGP